MPSLIDMRRRIRSVKNTQQITKAMKMVSAAKLRRAQSRVVASRPYGALLRKVLANVAAAAPSEGSGEESNPLLARRTEARILLVVITSDKGLAGAFNANIIKSAQHFTSEHADSTVQLELIGRKGRDFFRKRNAAISGEHVNLAAKAAYADTAAIARKAADLYRNDEIDAVYAIYNQFKSVASQKLTVERVLPIELPEQSDPVDYLFDQPPAEMLAALLPRTWKRNSTGRCWNRPRRACGAHDGDGRGHLQRRGHDREADIVHEPRAPGQHHQGNHRSGERRG
jgi:F-type H+-transporting ATPase subunit gamma